MAMETKQLHALSKIYNETVAKTEVKEAIGTAIATGAALGIAAGGAALIPKVKKFGQNLKNKAQQRTQMKTEEKMAKKDYDGDGKVESSKDEYFGSKDKAIKKAMGKKVNNESYSNWRQDLKEIPDYDQIPLNDKKKNEKISEKNVKNTIKINPEMKEEYGGKKKKKKHDCASKVKHEHFGIGDCISEAHDLDENGNVAHYDVEFKEYIVKGIPVEELEILEGSIHEHVIHEQKKSYETTKRKEVLAALKRDKRPLDKKTKEKIAAKIVKDKGDTSKSDDRYAYEDHVWDKVADMLTELGKLNDVRYRVEGYQRNPEEGERKESAAAKKGEAIRGQARRRMPPRGNKDREEFERWYAANVR